jgi:hypothetical protein
VRPRLIASLPLPAGSWLERCADGGWLVTDQKRDLFVFLDDELRGPGA